MENNYSVAHNIRDVKRAGSQRGKWDEGGISRRVGSDGIDFLLYAGFFLLEGACCLSLS